MGRLVPATNLQVSGLRKVYHSTGPLLHSGGILECLFASEKAVHTSFSVGLSHLQERYPTGLGGRRKQEGRQMDHSSQEGCLRSLLGGSFAGHGRRPICRSRRRGLRSGTERQERRGCAQYLDKDRWRPQHQDSVSHCTCA